MKHTKTVVESQVSIYKSWLVDAKNKSFSSPELKELTLKYVQFELSYWESKLASFSEADVEPTLNNSEKVKKIKHKTKVQKFKQVIANAKVDLRQAALLAHKKHRLKVQIAKMG